MKTLVFASRNRGKMVEVEHILNSLLGQDGVKLLNLDDIGYIGEIEETGQTFEENALAKAKMAYLKSGIPSFADDSGLEVDALRGEPGIYSARYA
ncbi:MAG TPA: non-canonical purine NTP pyrophosphatase, partial [Clostridiales bacterium]|nr:non-canonical purine NTP pyrophosphatase [Clostridiales bacterium]